MKHFKIGLWILMSLMMMQCSKEEVIKEVIKYPSTTRPEWKVMAEDFVSTPPTDWIFNQSGNQEKPSWSVDFMGTEPVPEWTVPDPYVYPTSMTAVIRLTPFLEKQMTDNDKMAAFINQECRGVATIEKSNSNISTFFLQIKAKDNEIGKVVLRYYSAKNHLLLSTDPNDLPYEVNKKYGTISEPAFPDFDKLSKYPIHMNATMSIKTSDLAFTPQANDLFAAFVGDECRGIGQLSNDKDKLIYSMDIRGKVADEKVVFKYYSAEKKDTYLSEKGTKMVALSEFGTIDSPMPTLLIPQSSMIAYMKIANELLPYATDADQLAAFVGNECRGVGKLIATTDGKRVYKIAIKGTEGQTDKIVLKYFNATCNYVYTTSNYLSFEVEGVHGTEQAPELLPLIQTDKHPLKMQVVCTLPAEQIQDAGEGDMIAAFVADECRGVANLNELNGTKIFKMEIHGSITNSEKMLLKYYCVKTSLLYTVKPSMLFEQGKQWGSEQTPEILNVSVQ
ncbi:MAG: hypothetical protein RR319_08420 [Bacteroides sp.]